LCVVQAAYISADPVRQCHFDEEKSLYPRMSAKWVAPATIQWVQDMLGEVPEELRRLLMDGERVQRILPHKPRSGPNNRVNQVNPAGTLFQLGALRAANLLLGNHVIIDDAQWEEVSLYTVFRLPVRQLHLHSLPCVATTTYLRRCRACR
jgi:hypothetical protein